MEYLSEDILGTSARSSDAHKGDFGKVIVVAGSKEYAGAAVLTAASCETILRVGADLAVACCPEKIAWLINNKLPDAITIKLKGGQFRKEHTSTIKKKLEQADVLLIGPGLGTDTEEFIRELVYTTKKPKVIDADAIKSVDIQEVENAVFTPHEQELEQLLNNSDLKEEQLQSSLKNNVILKKGEIDKIMSKTKVKYNKTGNSVMTKGGTGDVLAGMVAGFIAQEKSLFDAACKGVYLNGAVGDYLKEERGKTFIASDIVKNIHKVYK